jgi:hypothetical protein
MTVEEVHAIMGEPVLAWGAGDPYFEEAYGSPQPSNPGATIYPRSGETAFIVFANGRVDMEPWISEWSDPSIWDQLELRIRYGW